MTTLALSIWPLITLILIVRRPMSEAIAISLIGGYLLLPTEGGMDLPILPAFTKLSIPALTLLLLGFLFYRSSTPHSGGPAAGVEQDLPGWLPRTGVLVIGLVLVVVGGQMTALTNGDALVYGPLTLLALRPYDGFSLALTSFTTLIPLVLGRKFFAHPDRHRLLLKAIVIAGLGISFLALYEVRMSPQLNNIVYGFFPHNWDQHVRPGGFRPLVFMQHGLQLAIFFAVAIIAAFGLFRISEQKQKRRYLLAGLWLLGTLAVSNSLGALVIALLFIPLVLMLGRRAQLLCAAVIAGAVLLYPMLRSADVVPTDRLVSIAASIHEDRAGSLQFRFNNEDALLNRAKERSLFGWGIYSRAEVFTSYGRDTTTTDGAWIIVMGESGWVGYLVFFGFLALPTIMLAFARAQAAVPPETAILCLITAAFSIDLIPNAMMSPVLFLGAGALWGRFEQSRNQTAITGPEPTQRDRRGVRLDGVSSAPDSLPDDLAVQPSNILPYTRQQKRHQRLKTSP